MASDNKVVQTNKWGKETEQQLGADDHDSWRKENYEEVIPWEYGQFRELLEKYAKVPPDEVETEIYRIVSQAFSLLIDCHFAPGPLLTSIVAQ